MDQLRKLNNAEKEIFTKALEQLVKSKDTSLHPVVQQGAQVMLDQDMVNDLYFYEGE